MKKRLLALFLAFVMAMSLLPVSVFADGRTTQPISSVTRTENGVTVNKYVSGNAESGYNLTLEAYAENKVTSTTTTTPLDIVLVLDVSGSMNESFGQQGNRLSALKTAVQSFIDKVAKNAKETGTDHQISIVKFAGKASNNIGNETYEEETFGGLQTYNHSQIVTELTSVKTGAENLKTQVSALIAGGATQADYGMEYAETVLKNARQDSEKVVIMFTDGEPTSGRDYEASVAHDAVNTAKELKDDGVTVYTIGIFSRANPSDISGQTNKYMNAVSSNYPNAKSDTDDVYGIPYRWTITLGIRGEGEYYFASSSASDLEGVFDTIANTVTSSTLKVNPDEDAVLSDTLSDYFNFPDGLIGENPDGVTVQKVPVAGKIEEAYTWGKAEAVSGAEVTVTGDKIEVTGFNYKENAVTEETENGNKTYGGYKLVVTFPIEVDKNACLKNPVETGVYPTNSIESGSLAGLSYKSSDSAGSNNASTTLSGSPAVHLTDLDGNGTDVKVQVYVDGNLVTNPLNYITLTRDSDETAYNYIKTTVAEDGTISCDFNYDPSHNHGDCIDLLVTVAGNTYVLQGVRSYQDHGTSNVTQSDGAYKIDNVTAGVNTEDEDVDCTIYLRTKYSVEYYQNNSKLTEAPYNDSDIYVSNQDIATSTPVESYPTVENSAWMDWKNDNCKTSVTLPDLPTVENHDVSGWYLGSATNAGTTYTGPFSAINEESDIADSSNDNIIKFYATTALKRYNITINYVDGENHTLQNAYTESKNSGEQYSFDVSSDTNGTIPFIIEKDETQYVFNQISGSLSGTVTGPVNITAEYLLDSDKDGTPDKYEATVTYKVVNGTWDGQDKADKTANFILNTFNKGSNTWVNANPTLADSTNNVGIPTGMQPDETHVAPGAWDEAPTAGTLVTVPKTYTYTFNTSVNSKLKVEKTLEKVNVKAYTTGKVEADDVLTYTIKVTNTGNVSLSGIAVTDTFTGSAAPTTTTAAVTWTLDPASNSYKATWNVGELAAGANVTLTYTYTVRAADQGKTITNTAVAASGDTTGSDTNEVTVYNPDMTVTKAVTKVNDTKVDSGKNVVVQKGDVLTYTITVQNTGDQDLTNVVVTDSQWSDGTKITVSGVNNPVTPTDNSYTIGSLTEKAIVTITYTYTVTDTDVTAGKVTNKVSVTSNETPGGEGDETTTNVVGNYTIEASSGANGRIAPDGFVKVAAGANKTFTITADAGYHISDVTVDGVSKGAVSSYTFENVKANHTIHATFAKNSTPTSYTLYYHSNFGKDVSFYQSSSTRNMTVKEYENVGLLPERDGYVFVSWNTEPDGSGSRYMPGDTFRIEGSSDRLYAQWQKDKTGPDDSGVSNWLETDEHKAYLTGYPDSTFRADRNMTRAEVAQMFYALLLDKNVTITKSFSDVPDDAWYSTAVKTLASLGMMDGYPDGTFRPDEPITRAEFATVGLAFAYDPLDASCSYYDVGANAWYYTYVAQATTYGWIGGYPDNTFRPGNNITRVEVCVIVNNMLGRDADERYIDRHEDELVHFVDLSDSYWGYYTIMESTNTHEYTGSFTNEKWTDVK